MLGGRGNLLTEGKGHAGGNIVCPIHRWTYSSSGELLGAPHFERDPCLNLSNYPLRQWNGLLFEENGRDIAADPRGGEAYNMRLSQSRAESVVGYLAENHQIERGRLTPVGKGPTQLLNPARPEAPENRRVTIKRLDN